MGKRLKVCKQYNAKGEHLRTSNDDKGTDFLFGLDKEIDFIVCCEIIVISTGQYHHEERVEQLDTREDYNYRIEARKHGIMI